MQHSLCFLSKVHIVYISVKWIGIDSHICEQTLCNILFCSHWHLLISGIFAKGALGKILHCFLWGILSGQSLLKHLVIVFLGCLLFLAFFFCQCSSILICFSFLLSLFIRIYIVLSFKLACLFWLQFLLKSLFIFELLFYKFE